MKTRPLNTQRSAIDQKRLAENDAGRFVCAPEVLSKDLFEFHDIQHRKLRAVYKTIP